MTISFAFCLCVVAVLVICIVVILKVLIRLKKGYDALMESYRNLEELNSMLRAQRKRH